MFVTVQHKHSNRPFDSMNIWLEEVEADGFVVCLREFMSFDGIHTGLKVVSFKKLAQSSTITFFFVLTCYQLNLKLDLIVWKLIKNLVVSLASPYKLRKNYIRRIIVTPNP